MAKAKTAFVCQSCGALHGKWGGQCSDCGEWNTLVEQPVVAAMPHHNKKPSSTGYAGSSQSLVTLSEVEDQHHARYTTGLSEFDRVLGGGLVAGSVVLIGGDAGIGKSTLLLQVSTLMASSDTATGSAIYVTGEESLAQVAMRARRLGLPVHGLQVMSETQVETIASVLRKEQPAIAVIDSIQTIYTEQVSSAPGSVSQVRESAAILTRLAKQTGTTLLLVGHVTKEGSLAGPRVLEHMVDAVLYFDGTLDSRYRMIRAIKNRFGAVNELGVFAMSDVGLKEVSNPSAIFLNRQAKQVSGSVVMVSKEGTRPFLVEVQALVDTAGGPGRRVALGLDAQRLNMLLAVMHRHGGMQMQGQDVYINVVGGVKLSETGSDLAAVIACASSLKGKPLSSKLAVFGEVGLSGEVRPVQNGMERLNEAAKHGFTIAIIPQANLLKKQQDSYVVKKLPNGMTVYGVLTIDQALSCAFDIDEED